MNVLHRRLRQRSLWTLLWILSCCLLVFTGGCASGGAALQSSSATATPGATATPSAVSATATPVPATATATPAMVRQQRAQQILQGMSQDDKLAQMIVVEFIGSDYTESGLQQMIAQQHVGGYLYQVINNNFTAPNDSIDAVHSFSAQATHDSKIAPLIAIDEEGGLVGKADGFFGSTPSALDLAQSKNPQKAQQQAETDASNLKQLGINADLAPVVDVGSSSSLLQSRIFGDDPATVSTYAGAFLSGLQSKGMIGTLKHFPGLGSLSQDEDPHDSLPHVTRSLSDLESEDFVPYKNLIAQDQPAMVMTTDVVTEALDSSQAAELSPKVLHYLRSTLGFNGVVITDGLYMDGLYNGQDPTNDQLAAVAAQAVIAGNDMIEGPYTPDSVDKVIAALKTAIQQKKLSQSQVDQSVTRILEMKLQYGLIH